MTDNRAYRNQGQPWPMHSSSSPEPLAEVDRKKALPTPRYLWVVGCARFRKHGN